MHKLWSLEHIGHEIFISPDIDGQAKWGSKIGPVELASHLQKVSVDLHNPGHSTGCIGIWGQEAIEIRGQPN